MKNLNEIKLISIEGGRNCYYLIKFSRDRNFFLPFSILLHFIYIYIYDISVVESNKIVRIITTGIINVTTKRFGSGHPVYRYLYYRCRPFPDCFSPSVRQEGRVNGNVPVTDSFILPSRTWG